VNRTAWDESLSHPEPPESWPATLAALWWEAKGNWARAHSLVDHLDTAEAARVHAFLHRREGDVSNAAYWYRRAGVRPVHESYEEERETLLRELPGA
jgi:hypothetical protein